MPDSGPNTRGRGKGAESSAGLPVNRRKMVCRYGKITLGAGGLGTPTTRCPPSYTGWLLWPHPAGQCIPGADGTKSTASRCLLQPWPSPGTHLGALTLLLPGRGWPTERTLGARVHPCPLTLFKKLARKGTRLGHAQKALRTGSWVVGTAPRPPHATHAAGPGAVCSRQGPEGSGRASPQTRCTWALLSHYRKPKNF